MDVLTRKRPLRHRENCLRWGEAAAVDDPVRASLLNLARLYATELVLRVRSADCIADSRDLLLRADAVLGRKNRPREPALPAGG
ncbi:MAG TPA: hypothetical protein VLX44_19990 [Xanthobacteraceae bacterium]|nr:hypothetical protein [Xanthobacteraceae bacterium]